VGLLAEVVTRRFLAGRKRKTRPAAKPRVDAKVATGATVGTPGPATVQPPEPVVTAAAPPPDKPSMKGALEIAQERARKRTRR